MAADRGKNLEALVLSNAEIIQRVLGGAQLHRLSRMYGSIVLA